MVAGVRVELTQRQGYEPCWNPVLPALNSCYHVGELQSPPNLMDDTQCHIPGLHPQLLYVITHSTKGLQTHLLTLLLGEGSGTVCIRQALFPSHR